MTARLTAALDAIAARHAARPGVHALRCGIEHPASGFRWRAGAADESYPIASITKLYTTALVMQLRAEGAFGLDTPAATLLEAGTLDGLVVHDGRDWADAITVRELLAQTSGIPDYFEQPRADGTTFLRGALAQDAWTSLDDHLELSRTLPSPFPPSTPGRSHYSDTNFELLGRIVERVTGDSYAAALQTRILDPLGATGTRLFTGEETPDGPVTPVYHGRTALHLPRTIASTGASGALISALDDQLAFIRAFVSGELFPGAYLAELQREWNSVFSPWAPLEYGVGLMRFRLPRWQSPFAAVPPLIGHSGSVGSVLYHDPVTGVQIAGTVNQLARRSLPYPLLAQLALSCARHLGAA